MFSVAAWKFGSGLWRGVGQEVKTPAAVKSLKGQLGRRTKKGYCVQMYQIVTVAVTPFRD